MKKKSARSPTVASSSSTTSPCAPPPNNAVVIVESCHPLHDHTIGYDGDMVVVTKTLDGTTMTFLTDEDTATDMVTAASPKDAPPCKSSNLKLYRVIYEDNNDASAALCDGLAICAVYIKNLSKDEKDELFQCAGRRGRGAGGA